MNVETIDDIIDDMANKLGIYGGCKSIDPDGCDNDDICCCRVRFAMVMRHRIDRAVINEKIVNQLV